MLYEDMYLGRAFEDLCAQARRARARAPRGPPGLRVALKATWGLSLSLRRGARGRAAAAPRAAPRLPL